MAVGANTYGLGSVMVAAYKRTTDNWNDSGAGTGVACGAGDGIEATLAGTPQVGLELAENNASPGGVAIRLASILATRTIGGAIICQSGYGLTAQSVMLADLFGVDTVSANGDGSHEHPLTWAASQSLVGNLAWDDNMLAHDIPLTKVIGAIFTYSRGLPTIQFVFVGKDELTDDSGQNDRAQLANVTKPASFTGRTIKYPQVTAAQTTFRIVEVTGSEGSIGAAHEIPIDSITFGYARVPKQLRTNLNAPLVDEPVGGDWLPLTGEITFSHQYDDSGGTRGPEQWRSAIRSHAQFKADLAFVGDTIAGANKYRFFHEWPDIRIGQAALPQISGPDLVTQSFPFTAHKACTQPAGMAFDYPQMTITDEVATAHTA